MGVCGSLSDKFYVGLDLTGFENNGVQRPISRVTLKLDDENILTAGDDSGFELTADCPHATQAMVNSILAQVKGFQYQMYDASDINIDPAAELGDGITAGGVYSVISRVNDDGSGFPSASAPGEAELEDEYPAGGPMTQAFNRKIAETRSTITKTAEEIRLEVEKVNGDMAEMSSSFSVQLGKISQKVEDNINGLRSEFTVELGKISQKVEDSSSGLSSEFTVALNAITSRVQGVEGNVSTLQQTAGSLQSQITAANGNLSSISQKVDSITLSVENGSTSSTIRLLAGGVELSSQNITMSGLVTFSGLSDGTTTINGGCIKTGQIDAARLNLTGRITFSDLNSSTQSTINSASTNASSALTAANNASNKVNGWTYGGTTYIDGSKIMADTIIASKLKGGTIDLLGTEGKTAGRIGLSGVYNQTSGLMYIQSYLVKVGQVFNPLGTIYFGDFENNDEGGALYIHDDRLYIMGRHQRKVSIGYEGNDGQGGTFKDLLTVGYDTVTFNYTATKTVHCYNNLDMHNYSVLNTSDERLKTNIRASDINALEVIKAMRTYSFDWRESGEPERLGFIAQQLERDVSGDFVDISASDGHYSTKEMKMIPYLVKAVQELSEQIEQLKGAGA